MCVCVFRLVMVGKQTQILLTIEHRPSKCDDIFALMNPLRTKYLEKEWALSSVYRSVWFPHFEKNLAL
mgnify:CR=1 FL=1